jgi:HEAT repeat protein
MSGIELVLLTAGLMLGVGLLTILAWLVYTSYLDRVERRLAARKGLYRELVSELATRDRTLLEPTIHQMSTLYDLDALEAVLEEQARTATGRPSWLLEVYDQLGLVDKYIEKLRSARKWRDRAFAAELLGRVGSAKAVPALLETVQATQTEDSDVREIALRALARIADPQAVEPLIAALASADAWLAPRIADILARHGDAVVDPLLTVLGGSGSHPARAWAANVLGEVKAQRAFPTLVRCLDDADEEVRAKAATALGRLGDRRAVHPLLDHLLTDPAPFVRVRIATTLGQLGGPEVMDRLVRSLGDPAWWVRMRAVEALEQIGSPVEGPLVIALNDPDPEIRRRAAVALERLGVPGNLLRMIESGDREEEAAQTLVRLAAAGTRELLAELLQHPAPRVREVVLSSIRQAKRVDAAPELTRIAAGDPEPSLRRLAFDSLRRLGAVAALPVALAGVADADPDVRAAAIAVMGQVGDRSVLDILRSQTEDADPRIRGAAIRALGNAGGRIAQSDFMRLLGDPDPFVREAAIEGVMQARLRGLAPAIAELLADSEQRVRHLAVRALKELGDPTVVPALLRAFPTADPDLQGAIILAINRLDPSAVAELLERLIESDDGASRRAVARALTQLRGPAVLQHLARLAGDDDPEVRATALAALGRGAGPSGRPPEVLVKAVTNGLIDPSERVRATAVDVCSRRCLEDHGRALLALLEEDPAALVRERAALAIGLLRVPGGETPLITACRRAESLEVRAAAALAAGAYDRNSLIMMVLDMPDQAAIRELLRHRMKADPWFRLLSRQLPRASDAELRALAAASPDQAQFSLAAGMRAALETSERVRLITGLQAFQGERSRDLLLQLVRADPSAEVRAAALTAVRELLDPDELLAFGSRALGDPHSMVRRAAVGLFAGVPPRRALPRLLHAMRADDDPAVLAAVAGLAAENFAPFRDAVLQTPLESNRAVLVARLARYLHHPELSTLLAPLAQSSAPEVREAVAEVWHHRPDSSDPVCLEALTRDPVVTIRRTAVAAAVAAQRYDLLDRMTQDPEVEIRREVAIRLGEVAQVDRPGLVVLEHLEEDSDMSVRAAAHVARLLRGIPIPHPPNLDVRVAAEAVRGGADVGTLRNVARSAPSDDRRLAAALALALIQDDVAHEVARSDPAPAVRHRVGGALELSLPVVPGDWA